MGANNVGILIKVNITGGPGFSITDGFSVEAYDKIDVTVEENASDKPIDIQPGGQGQIQLLMITSSKYSEDLSYKVHETGADPITLDKPQVYLGTGSVGLLGDNIDKIFVSNGMTEAVDIEIFVCRDATP